MQINHSFTAVSIFIIWNIIVSLFYFADKSKAKRNKYRISEKTLLLLAFFMGGTGAFLGMNLLRHKTKHLKFQILIPVFMILNFICIYLYIIYI